MAKKLDLKPAMPYLSPLLGKFLTFKKFEGQLFQPRFQGSLLRVHRSGGRVGEHSGNEVAAGHFYLTRDLLECCFF